MTVGVQDFSFAVSDLDRSVAWYTDVLGLELVHRQRQEDGYAATLVRTPDMVLEISQFAVPGVASGSLTHMLELVEYEVPRYSSDRDGITLEFLQSVHIGQTTIVNDGLDVQ